MGEREREKKRENCRPKEEEQSSTYRILQLYSSYTTSRFCLGQQKMPRHQDLKVTQGHLYRLTRFTCNLGLKNKKIIIEGKAKCRPHRKSPPNENNEE